MRSYFHGDRNKKEIIFFFFSMMIIIFLITGFIFFMTNSTIEGNINRRATTDSEFLSVQQADLIHQSVLDEALTLSCIADMIERGMDFSGEENQNVLKAFVEKFRYCMMGYANKDGDVINYQGEMMGNISDRNYYESIISGKESFVCQYMDRTALTNDPRLIFSVPVYLDGEINGVLFSSKEVDILKDSLFQKSMFQGNDSSIIINQNGDILIKNDKADKNYKDEKNIRELWSHPDQSTEQLLSDIGKDSSGSLFLNEGEAILSYAPIDFNGWHLVSIIDRESARVEYAGNLMSIRMALRAISAAFIIAGLYFLLIVIIQMLQSRKASERYRMQYERSLSLLKEMDCVVLEYNLNSGIVKASDELQEICGYKIEGDFLKHIPERKLQHPEFHYKGLMRELKYAIETSSTISFESPLLLNKKSYKILSITMMPLLDVNGVVTDILGSVRETSARHRQMRAVVDHFDQIPGGVYRCCLENPVRLDWIWEGFSRMLGYEEGEFKKIVDQLQTELIAEEDRETYKDFLRGAASSPGISSCRYRIMCKDGSFLSVVDTMESVRTASGMIYGYSAVMDSEEYEKYPDLMNQELKEMEVKLEMARIKNSSSQMQPHFLYNALGSIREVILIDQEYASDLICDFTTYLRGCIRAMQNDKMIPISQEIENIMAYVNIEKMRMGKRLHVEYDLHSEEFLISPLTLQPLIENAIRHGIFHKGPQGGTVNIRTETLSEYNQITIQDNGVGFDYQKIQEEIESGERDSTGLNNIIFRLSKQLNADISIESEIGTGTVVSIRIPRERIAYESDNRR